MDCTNCGKELGQITKLFVLAGATKRRECAECLAAKNAKRMAEYNLRNAQDGVTYCYARKCDKLATVYSEFLGIVEPPYCAKHAEKLRSFNNRYMNRGKHLKEISRAEYERRIPLTNEKLN